MSTTDLSPGVRVVVTPSQSSFFAGELFSVTVTFTNTHSTSTQAGPSSSSSRAHTHKRGAHSISSAPLARPPTSPGPPRTPVPSSASSSVKATEEEDASVRRGLVGKVMQWKGTEDLSELLEQRRKRLLAKAKSLSVSIAPHELEEMMMVPPGVVPTSLTRSESLALGAKHPHARKQSVFDGQAEVSTMATATPASSSSSTFSLALDPIVEGVSSPYPSTPSLASPTIEPATFNNVYSGRSFSARRQSLIGLGHPSSLQIPTPRSASTSSFPRYHHNSPYQPPNSELLLYSYAQLKGTLSLTPPAQPSLTPEQKHTIAATRAALLKRPILGGGRMDISSSLHPLPGGRKRRPTHSRTSSFSGLLNLISPTVTPSLSPSSTAFPPLPPSPGLRGPVSPRLPSSPVPVVGLGIGVPMPDEDIDPEVPLPTFEVQPAMLAVDLVLAPGESRSYTYSLLLPDVLPPTFKGRSLKFSYELEIGTCRAGHGHGPGSTSASSSISRVMKVPIRVYNNVVVGRTLMPYDMLWPLSKAATTPLPETQGKVVEVEKTGKVVKRVGGKSPTLPPQPTSVSASTSTALPSTLDDLRDYAQRLLDSFPEPGARGVRIKVPAESISPVPRPIWAAGGPGGVWTEEEKRLEREMERAEEGLVLSGCREAVEILTRNPKKASYDVHKDGVKVAVLTFPKGAYRLGETVVGVVEINTRQSRARVLQLSAILETHETLPSTLSPSPSPSPSPSTRTQTQTQTQKRIHAEHHSSHLPSTLRTTFTLDIPSDASPAFLVRLGREVGSLGGLEWKVRLCLLVAVAGGQGEMWEGSEGVSVRGMRRVGGRGEWGSCWVAGGLAPMEKVVRVKPRKGGSPKTNPNMNMNMNPKTMGWGAFLAASLFGGGGASGVAVGEREKEEEEEEEDEEEEEEEEEEGYDGIKPDLAGGVGIGVDYGGGETGWRDVKMETVECEVPIRMWPGNTAFKAADIVFDV